MCGFVGYIDKTLQRGCRPSESNQPAENITQTSYEMSTVIHAMADAIAHRGPDGEGYFIEENAGAALGFRRLSIIDLEGGNQPMTNEDGTLVLCFNGEIYNHRELREELIAAGHHFVTQCDSEVVLHGFEQWREALLPKLRGMFAFVVYDRKLSRLFGARDAFGIKPLYYQPLGARTNLRDASDGLIFASEIKGMLAHPRFHKACNEQRIPHYLCYEYLPDDETLFQRVYKLPAGHFMTWEAGKLNVERWFAPSFAPKQDADASEVTKRIAYTVRQSVHAHAIADVEVGSFLSAGVDSSLVAFEANQIMDLKTFSVGWAEQKYSELDAAATFAGQTGIQNSGRTISAEEFFNAVPAVQYAMDEPLSNPSAVPLWFLTHFAAESVKVVMSGEGADELFGGYPLYQEALAYEPYMTVPRLLRKLAGTVAQKLPPFHGRRFLMRGAHDLDRRFARSEYVFTQADWEDILAPRLLDAADPYDLVSSRFEEMPSSYDEVTRMQQADIATWLSQDILLKADKMSMAASLELRVPFLDKEVWDVARTLPTYLRVRKGETKVALREAAAQELPPKTAAMPKLGFLTPLNEWLKQEPWRSHVASVLNSETAARFFNRRALNRLLEDHVNGVAANMRKIWNIYCFCIWHDQFFKSK